MKLGDLLRWEEDNDIGIVVGFQECGLPLVRWCGETHLHEFALERTQTAGRVYRQVGQHSFSFQHKMPLT